MRSDNVALHTLSHFIHNSAMAVGSVYNVYVLPMSHTVVKNAAWSSFTSLLCNVLGLYTTVFILLQFDVFRF